MYRILNSIPDKSSCSYYRNHLPAIKMRDELRLAGIQVDTPVSFDPNLDYDCYIFARIPHDGDFFPIVDSLYRRGKKIIWDIDDELWNVPETNPAHEYYKPKRLVWLNYYFFRSTKIISSTYNLAKSISNTWSVAKSKIVVLENLIDEDMFKFIPSVNRDAPIKILWTGSDSHAGDMGPVDAVFKHYENNPNVTFVFFGWMPERFQALHPNKLTFISGSNRKYYERTLALIAPHISLIPLEETQFNICKSAIKYYETAMAGATCIASDVQPYSDVIIDKETGFLCRREQDWIGACEEAIQSKGSLVNNSINIIKNKYSWDSDNKRRRDWVNFFKSIPDL